MVNDLVFCALALRATPRSVAPASIFINDRRSVMQSLSLQVFELQTRRTLKSPVRYQMRLGYSRTKIWDFHLEK